MPRLWEETIEAHRRAVHDAVLEAAAALAAGRGRRPVTMARIAKATGIGRATLYRHFPDVNAILGAWHAHLISQHLALLTKLRDETRGPGERLEALLSAYAFIQQGHQGTELEAVLHRAEHVDRAKAHLLRLFREVLAEGARAGVVRRDVGPDELARYCFHALAAAAGAPSKGRVQRLVRVVLSGLRPPASRSRPRARRALVRSIVADADLVSPVSVRGSGPSSRNRFQ